STVDSGVKKCASPFKCEWNSTPSSVTLRRLSRLNTWNPPESVKMARGHAMNLCRPPRRSMRSCPGLRNRWYVLARMILASNSCSRSRCITPLTVACVPTGMKTGVSIVPCAVCSRPARAPVTGHSASISNRKTDILFYCDGPFKRLPERPRKPRTPVPRSPENSRITLETAMSSLTRKCSDKAHERTPKKAGNKSNLLRLKLIPRMPLRLYNTLTQELEEFRPIRDNIVRMYTCGPTVYNYAHIGNLRTYTFQDILRRWLSYRGFKLDHVMNITDVEDKIIANAAKEGKSLEEYTEVYTKAFFEDAAALRLQRPEQVAKATEHIGDMVEAIEKLSEKGHTYATEGSTYFRISTFPEYGKVSHNDFSGVRSGARVDMDEYEKADARDF